jgi:hypothetical protein
MKKLILVLPSVLIGITGYSSFAAEEYSPIAQSGFLVGQNTGQCAGHGSNKSNDAIAVTSPGGELPLYAGRTGIDGNGKNKWGVSIDVATRCIFFKDVNPSPQQTDKPKQTWVVIHGWDDDSEGDIKRVAEAIARRNPGDRVLLLDWSEASRNAGDDGANPVGKIPILDKTPLNNPKASRGNYYAATWIARVAEVVVQQLKTKYGISGAEAEESLNLVGHSLGSIFQQFNNREPTSITANSWSQVSIMQNQLTAITQGGSSHIGSAAYFIGRSPVQDSVREQQYSGARIPNLQQRSEYTDGFILQPPVDVVLTWNQNTKLDLDSHLTGPPASADQNNPVRFHTYWNARGSLDGTPNALLYRDTIPDPDINLSRSEQARQGPEQTRINVVQPGVYRFYVHNYSNANGTLTGNAAGAEGLSISGARVEVYNAGNAIPSFDPNNPTVQGVGTRIGQPINAPTGQQGNVWAVFELDTRTGILRKVNIPFGNINDPAKVPSANPAEIPR